MIFLLKQGVTQMTNLTKAEQSQMLALMCRGKRVTIIDAVVPAAVSPHTGYIVPNIEEFGDAYLASIMGDRAVLTTLDEYGQVAAETQIARKRGQEWRDEVELQESGEIVGYWGGGQ